MTTSTLIEGILNAASSTTWERGFAAGVARHQADGRPVSDRQLAILNRISGRLGDVPISSEVSRISGQNHRDGTRARVRESGHVPSRFPSRCDPSRCPVLEQA